MSDRYIALTVLLEKPIKDEDAEQLIQAIMQLRGVMDVTPVVQDVQTLWIEQKIRNEIGEKLMKVLYPTPS